MRAEKLSFCVSLDEAELAIIGADNQQPMNAHEQADARLRSLLPIFEGRLSRKDARMVEELIDHNECGIALENLCTQLHEVDAKLSASELVEIRAISSLLNLDVSYLSA